MPITGYLSNPLSLQETPAAAAEEFSQPNNETEWNFRMVVEGKSIYVNRKYLAAISPVFNKMFFDPKFPDSTKAEIQLNGKQYGDVLEFIRAVAVTFEGKHHRKVDANNLQVLLDYADEYQVGILRERCSSYIRKHLNLPLKSRKERESLEHLFCLCYQHRLDALTEKLIPKVARFPYNEIKAIVQRIRMDSETLNKITDLKLSSYAEKEDKRRRSNQLTKEFLQVRARHHTLKCSECAKPANYQCVDCTAGFSTAYFCEPCFDGCHVVRCHNQQRLMCSRCDGDFLPSTLTEPDMCDCIH